MEQIIIVGGFHEMIELCEDAGREVIGILDLVDDTSYLGYPILGKDENVLSVKWAGRWHIILVCK